MRQGAAILAGLALLLLSCNADVVVLDDSNYTEFTSSGQWIVKFHAPWCGHCKRLAPVFRDAEAAAGSDAARFATVDCTVATGIAQRVGVRGYPTLKIVSGGKTSDLRVPRTKHDLAAVARRLTAPAVTIVTSPKELKELVDSSQNPVLALGPMANEMLAGSFRNVAEYWKHEQVYAELTFGDAAGVVRLEKGDVQPVLYDGEMDAVSVEAWARAAGQRHLSLTSLDHTNFVSVINAGRPVAMAVVDPASAASRRFLAAYRRLALPGVTSLSDAVRDSFLFGSLDGKTYSDALKQYNVSPDDLPRVVVIDGSSGTFFEDPLVREITDVASFLGEVSRGEFPAQRSGVWALPTQVYNMVVFGEQGWLVGAGVAAVAVALVGVTVAFSCWVCSGEDGEEDDEEAGDVGAQDGARSGGDKQYKLLDAALRRAAELERLGEEELAQMSEAEMRALLERHGMSVDDVMGDGVDEEILRAAHDAADAEDSEHDGQEDGELGDKEDSEHDGQEDGQEDGDGVRHRAAATSAPEVHDGEPDE